ncbi:DNA-binding protein WhiA [Mycoplasma corogypsi]|uniref:DNA-binding protein WhiA n=1 Tax=Mycoplasma corogypsi TaxID=2106 RepID=UPI0038737F94
MQHLNKNSFSWEVKKEIINNATSEKEIIAFINGLIYSNATIDTDQYIFNIKNEYILDKIIHKLGKVHIPYYKNAKWISKLTIDQKDLALSLALNFGDYLTFFFAGVFCGSGNISSKQSTSYHLEISSHYKEFADKILEVLNKYEFGFQYLHRNNKHILYVKKLDKLFDFLSAIGAKKSWFKLQDIRINRDKENVVNRINNIDISNLKRIAKSSLKHIENIDYIYQNNLEHYFDENQLVFFRLKQENKWSSLVELVHILETEHNIFITKSGINHWLRKLTKVVEDHKENKI